MRWGANLRVFPQNIYHCSSGILKAGNMIEKVHLLVISKPGLYVFSKSIPTE